jgi:hypothetical protein
MEDESDIEEIVLNLKMISKIKQNNKLVVINKMISVDNRLLQPFQRWYSADNREDALQFITTIVNRAIEYTYETNTSQLFDPKTIKQELTNILPGLDNLSATYKLDYLVVAKIDLIKNKIEKLCFSVDMGEVTH